MDIDIKIIARRERCRSALLADLHYLTSLIEDDASSLSAFFDVAQKDLKRSLKSYIEAFK